MLGLEGDGVHLLDLELLVVGKARRAAVLEDGLAGRVGGADERGGAVADGEDDLALLPELRFPSQHTSLPKCVNQQLTHLARQLHVRRVRGEVDDGAMTADVEDGRVVVWVLRYPDLARAIYTCEKYLDSYWDLGL